MSVEYLKIFALLHCQGSDKDKTNLLFDLLQEGGEEAHSFIAASDKDIDTFWDKACDFVTKELISIINATETGSNL